jgi:hypothetical protein
MPNKGYLDTKEDSLEYAAIKAVGEAVKPVRKLPRQLKDPKREKMVGTKKGTKVVDRNDPRYKNHPEHESVEMEGRNDPKPQHPGQKKGTAKLKKGWKMSPNGEPYRVEEVEVEEKKDLPPWLKKNGKKDDDDDNGKKNGDDNGNGKNGDDKDDDENGKDSKMSKKMKTFKKFQKKDKENQDEDPVGEAIIGPGSQSRLSPGRPAKAMGSSKTKTQRASSKAKLKDKEYGVKRTTRMAPRRWAESKEVEDGERDVGSDKYANYIKQLTPGEGITNKDARKADARDKKEKAIHHHQMNTDESADPLERSRGHKSVPGKDSVYKSPIKRTKKDLHKLATKPHRLPHGTSGMPDKKEEVDLIGLSVEVLNIK